MKPFLLLAVALCAGCSAPINPVYSYLLNDCVNDHRRAPVSQSVVHSYCACMAGRRSRDPLRPDPRDQEFCQRRSGWT